MLGLSRRNLFRRSALMALPAMFRGQPTAATLTSEDVYQSIGVRPLINARGTFTIISGSLMLPEVRAAIDAAARHHASGRSDGGHRNAPRRTEKAEFGLVSSGCAAALTNVTPGSN